MTLDKLVTLVRQMLAMHKTLDINVIYSHIELAQSAYEQPASVYGLPWFMFTTSTVTLTAGENKIALPVDFLSFDDDVPLRVADTDTVLARRNDYQLAYKDVGTTPSYFSVRGTDLWFAPQCTIDVAIDVPYYKQLTSIVLDPNTPWLKYFPRLILMETVASLAAGPLRDADGQRMALTELAMLRPAYQVAVAARRNVMMSVNTNSYVEE